jgi:WD40 repeat protein
MAPCPSREDLLATLHSEGGGRQTTLWRLTGLGEEIAGGALRPLEQLVTLSEKSSSGGGMQVGSVVWSPEDPQAVASTDGRRICIWSLQESDYSAANLRGSADAPGAISACCWGGPPGTTRLLSSSNGSIHAWDPRTLGGSPATVAVARAHGGAAVLSLDCNPLKPHQVLSGGADLLLKCWDVRKGSEPLLTLPGHSHWATSTRYNPSHDQLVLSGSADHTVRPLTIHSCCTRSSSMV